jgi:hypothetical protein
VAIGAVQLVSGHEKISLNGWFADVGETLESGDPGYLRYALQVDAGKFTASDWFAGTETKRIEAMPVAQPVSSYTGVPLRMPEGDLIFRAVQCQIGELVLETLESRISTALHKAQFDLACHAAGGRLEVSGDVSTDSGYLLHLKLAGDSLRIRDCFDQCRDFGQEVVRGTHLQGRCNLRLLASVPWSLEGALQRNDVHVYAGLSVQDGELINLSLLEQFAAWVHEEDLRHIRFERLDNVIEVRNGNVYIPAMFVQSNAANLVVNGVHSLDNRILYNLKINAGQVLAARMKKHNPILSPLPAREQGTFNLFFTLTGTTGQPEYSMNRSGVESSFTQSTTLRNEITEALRQAFDDIQVLIEPPGWETIPEYDLEIDGEDVFLEGH